MRPLIPDIAGNIVAVRLKVCAACKSTKPTTDFYRDKYTSDRLGCYCKPCAKSKGRTGYYRHREKILAQKAERRKEPEWHSLQKPSLEAYRLRNMDKVNARQKTRRALAKGKIQKLPCETCGNARSYPHHHDYSKPLEVHWLCYSCHGKEHRTSPEGLAALAEGK